MDNCSFEDLDSRVEKLIDQNPNLKPHERFEMQRKWYELKAQKLNIMVTGATGCGKSSTINALFNMSKASREEVAKIGTGPEPETMQITKYTIGNMVLWDSPGLGDGMEADRRHARNIIDKLNEVDEDNKLLIDLVLVILDGSTRDLGTSYELINRVIIPNLGKNKKKRILVAINQADAAMNGRHWDNEKNCPDATLENFLQEKCESVRSRIHEGTGVDIYPIYYSAGYKEEGKEQEHPYNLAKLLYFILEHIPEEKRLVAVTNMNSDAKMWADSDGKEDYGKKIQESTRKSVAAYMATGAAIGGAIGSLIPGIGTAIGSAIGSALGAICSWF